MRVKVIFTNYEIEGISNFIVAVPFQVQSFEELDEHLCSHFDLPTSTKLSFALDGFSILHKESVNEILKELDTLKITLKIDGILGKRKGIGLNCDLKKIYKKDDSALNEFIRSMMQISKMIKEEERMKDSNNNENDEEENGKYSLLQRNKEQQKMKEKNKVLSSQESSSSSSDSSDVQRECKEKLRVSKKQEKIVTKQMQSKTSQENLNKDLLSNRQSNNQQQQFVSAKTFPIVHSNIFSKGNSGAYQIENVTYKQEERSQTMIGNSNKQSYIQKNQMNKWVSENSTPQISNKNASISKLSNTSETATFLWQEVTPKINKKMQNEDISTEKQTSSAKPSLELIKQKHMQNLSKQSITKPVLGLQKSAQGLFGQSGKEKMELSSLSSSSISSESDIEDQINQVRKQTKIQLSSQHYQQLQSTQKSETVDNHLTMTPKENIFNSQTKSPLKTQLFNSKSEISNWTEEKNMLNSESGKQLISLQSSGTKPLNERAQLLFKPSLPIFHSTAKETKESALNNINKEIQKEEINMSNEKSNMKSENNKMELEGSNQITETIQIMEEEQIKTTSKDYQLSSNTNLPPFDLKNYEKQDLNFVKEYEINLMKSFFNEGDQIYFKDMELDEENQQQVPSKWKRGTITQIISNKQIRLSVHSTLTTESKIFNSDVFVDLFLKSLVPKKNKLIEIEKANNNMSKVSSNHPQTDNSHQSYELGEIKEVEKQLVESSSQSREAISIEQTKNQEEKENMKNFIQEASPNSQNQGKNIKSAPKLNLNKPISAEGDKDILIGRQVIDLKIH